MKKTVAAALVLASASTFAVPVSYGSSAAFTGLSYRLIDLTPTDGVAASVSFANTSLIGTFSAVYEFGSPWKYHYSIDAMGESSRSKADGGAAHASSFIAGGPNFQGVVSGWGMGNGYSADVGALLDFKLGAGTAIEWTAAYTLSAWVVQTAGAKLYDEGRAFLHFGDATYHLGASAWGGPASTSLSGVATYRVDNASASEALRTAYFAATASGGQVSPVPEPSSLALALAGLGVVGVVTRRSRVRQPAPGQPS